MNGRIFGEWREGTERVVHDGTLRNRGLAVLQRKYGWQCRWRCSSTGSVDSIENVSSCPAISFALDPEGFVRTGTDQHTPRPLPLESSIPGVFAVGHVRAGSAKRVGGAIGERAAVGGAGPYCARGRPDGEALIYHVMRAAPGEYALSVCSFRRASPRQSKVGSRVPSPAARPHTPRGASLPEVSFAHDVIAHGSSHGRQPTRRTSPSS